VPHILVNKKFPISARAIARILIFIAFLFWIRYYFNETWWNSLLITVIGNLAFLLFKRCPQSISQNEIWPIIETNNIDEMVNFYINKLGFTLEQHINNNDTWLMLYKFTLVLRKSSNLKILINTDPFGSPGNNAQLVLYIQVPYPEEYYKTITSRGAKTLSEIISETPIYTHDFSGFYVKDPDNNIICFFEDSHGPYEAHWDLSWENRML
jgi:predicted enzyme related to lactoylglutathione lyase